MSRLTDALQKAQEARRRQAENDKQTGVNGSPTPGKDELWDHVRRLEDAFRRRDAELAQQAAADAGLAQPPAAPAASIPAVEPPAAPAKPAATATTPSTPSTLEERLSQIQEELMQCEQLSFRQQAAQAALRAKAAAYEDLSAQVTQEKDALQQQVQQADEAGSSIEATKRFWQKQLDALLACHTLSRTAKMVEEELALARQMTRMLSQSRKRLEEEQTHYDSRSNELQELTDRLQARLKQALQVMEENR